MDIGESARRAVAGATTAFIILTLGIFGAPGVHAQTSDPDDLRDAIEDRNEKIQDIQEEIAQYQQELQKIGTQKKTLQTAVNQLQTTDKKLSKELELTNAKIEAAELTISELNDKIADQKERIEINNQALSQSLRQIQESGKDSLIETILNNKSLADFWSDLDSLQQFQVGLEDDIATLRALRTEYEKSIAEQQSTHTELSSLKGQLDGQRAAVVYAKNEKNQLLSQTKNQEASYQSLIEEKQQLQAQFEAELNEYQAQLKIAIDPSRIPQASPTVLSYPVDSVIITQRFGDTAFAQTGAYNGHGHNGVDFGVPIGTPVKAALSGTVWGVGNTDTACPNASYGKWILVKHANGLATLYGHLSVQSVSEGQTVTTGQVIGYSGLTGYTTGPHLHFTVLASQGAQVANLASRACPGRTYRLPVADLSAYLDPLSFLP